MNYCILSLYIYKGSIILNSTDILEQFQLFYKDQKPANLEDAVEKFAIFGGVNWGSVDTSKPSYELIEKLILQDYRFIRNDITELTGGAPLYHSVLTGVAQGDGGTHSSFKRAKVDDEAGSNAVEELTQRGIVRVEKAKNIFTSWDENEKVDNRLYFNAPFLRFWFAFISPLFKGIRDGDFKEIKQKFDNKKSEFTQLGFIQLSHELLKKTYTEDNIQEISSFWDRKNELDIYAKTASGKIIVGSCKYSNAKVKKSELSRLQEICKESNIKADIFIIVAKKGFSNELKSLKSEQIKLLTLKSFKNLLL